MKKILYFDCETTGLSAWKHGIWQYGAIFEEGGKEKGIFDKTCFPLEGSEIDPAALIALQLPPNYFGEGGPLVDSGELVFNQFRAWLLDNVDKYDKRDKMLLVGYNVKFDEEFLRRTWKKMKDNYYGSIFTTPSVDVMQLAALELGPEWLKMKDHKLATVAERILGTATVRDADWHDAMTDIHFTRLIFRKIYDKRWKV